MSKKREWQVPADLDPECRALCVALNKLPGVMTTCSCCGHGDQPDYKPRYLDTPIGRAMTAAYEPDNYQIFFQPKTPEAILPLLFWMQKCHSSVKGNWRVEIYTDCASDYVFYMLEGPIGNVAYEDALVIANCLEQEMKPTKKGKK